MRRSGRVVHSQSLKLEQGAESRRRILHAAAELMAESGYTATSVSSVSRRSGLPASSIYWHFGSKAGLVAAIIEEGACDWFEKLPQLDEIPGKPEQQVATMFEAAATELEARPEFLRLIMLIALERSEADQAAAEVLDAVREHSLGLLRDAFLRLLYALDPTHAADLADEFAEYAIVVSSGAFVQSFLRPEGVDVRKVFSLLLDSMMAFVREQTTANRLAISGLSSSGA